LANRIPQAFIDDLMARVDIVDVVEERVALKKAGKEYVACCPFHNEKTPSFTVSPEKQFYHCFGCGAHGTALGFLIDYAQLNFPEAVQELAQRVGMQLPDAPEADGDDGRAGLYVVLSRAQEFYRAQLRENAHADAAVGYLKQRGLSAAIAAEFGIGYAPPGWDNLARALASTSSEQRLLAAAGLTATSDGGRHYDRFRNRITFPISDRRGQIVGFGGRALDDSSDSSPKYLNSPETPVFHKGRELYGLFQARAHHRRLERVIVVEGYLDVVALAQYGIRNAVATLGTAATSEQLEQLLRLCPNVDFCFDGDSAGRSAAWRALQTALPLARDGRRLGFLFLPRGEDPDSFVRQHGADAFRAELEQAVSLSTFLFDHLLERQEIATLEGRAQLVEVARPLLGRLPAGAFRLLAINRLSELSGVEAAEIAAGLGAQRPSSRQSRRARTGPGHHAPSLVRTAISLLLHEPQLATSLREVERLHTLALPGAGFLCELIDFLKQNTGMTTGGIIEHFRHHTAGRHLAKLASTTPLAAEGVAQEFQDCIRRLAQAVDDQRYEYLARKSRVEGLSGTELDEYRALARPTSRATFSSVRNDS
jgi:DNA primase